MAKHVRVVSYVIVWFCLLFLGNAVVLAQVCQQAAGGPSIGFTTLSGGMNAPKNCAGLWSCQPPIISGVEYEPRPPGCDPVIETCNVRGIVPLEFPGFRNNTLGSGFFDSPAKLNWTNSGGGFAGTCGNAAARIQVERGEAWAAAVGFSCADPDGASGDSYNLEIVVCDGVSGCQKVRNRTVDLRGPTLAAALCPPPPRPWSCNESNSCQAGCMGANGSGAAGSGAGGSSAAGGGPGLGGRIFGGGAFLRYQAGGVGVPTNPLPADWTQLLGRFWSHDYAERIVPDPDDSHVWLLTKNATYREFSDSDMDGVYDVAVPSDEYRALTKTPAGWELRQLDGMVHAYDLDGLWLSSTDRNGNAKTGTYDAMDRVERVDFPDGRYEFFAYDGSGRLDSITEVGVDGTSTRVWDYDWTGDDLTAIARPDGRSWSLLYDDPAHPGFITRLTLIGDDGASERIEGAWEYDANGNVTATWRGAVDKDDPGAVEKWLFEFDDPTLPVTTTVTDPLGKTSMHTFGRDGASSKPRLEGVTGDCPTSCARANSTTAYDPLNPLRPDTTTNGRGFVTHMDYDSFGQITSRTEAFGEPEERTTAWQYDPSFPALVRRVERPSTTGQPMDLRVTEYLRDASGNVTNELREGVENGSAFSDETVRTYTPQGMVETLDGPDHGTADLVTFVYDTVDRGGLVLDQRIDPLIGTTDYGYDAFNRRTSITDVNGTESMTEYDPADRVRFVRQAGAAGDGAEDLVTENRYTTFGDLFQVILPAGNVIEYAYDAAGRLLSFERKPDDQPSSHGERTRYELNEYGQRELEVHERWEMGAWVEQARTAYEYATRCHLDKITAGSGADQSVTEYAYDCNTNLEKIWDANHPSSGQSEPASTEYAYDALDRLVEVRQPFGGDPMIANEVVISYGYDVQDHLVEVIDGEGTVTGYVYSDRDLITEETSEVSGVTDYTYTASGELETKTDARPITETRSYDALDRLIRVDYPDDSLDITYAYDDPGLHFGIGRLASIARAGHSVDYDYDRFGRLIQDGELSFGYDQNGNRSTIGYPGGAMSTYTFDYADREATLSHDAGSGAESIVVSASYLPSGPLDGLVLGNGLEEARPYDSRYYPDAIRVTDGVIDLLHWDYTVDGLGNPTAIVDVLDSANDRTYAYQDYQYFLTQGDGPWGTRAWTYDTIGNRLTEQKDGGFVDEYGYMPNAAAEPGNSPKLAQITASGGIRTFMYDDAGNQTQVSAGGNVIDRRYDDAGRMSRQERASASASADFLYDGRSFLRSAVGREPASPGVGVFCDGFESGDISAWGGAGGVCLESSKTGPVYDSSGLLHAVDTTHILYFAGRPVAQLEAVALFLTTDHLGAPIQATDDVTVVAWEGGFEPFGQDYAGAQATGVFLRLPGQWEDSSWSTSSEGDPIFFNVFRWYSTSTGRYLRTDPLRLWSGVNLFNFVLSNPARWLDPLGLEPVCCTEGSEVLLDRALEAKERAESIRRTGGFDVAPGSQPLAQTVCGAGSLGVPGDPTVQYFAPFYSLGPCEKACTIVHEASHARVCKTFGLLVTVDLQNLDEALGLVVESRCLVGAARNGTVDVEQSHPELAPFIQLPEK